VKRKIFSVSSVLLILIISIAILVPGCDGGGGEGTIDVNATLDGDAWPGAVDYTLTPDSGSPITGTSVPGSHTAAVSNWTCSYDSGGPPGADLLDITPSATQELSDGGTITFTLEFVTPQALDAFINFVTWTINGTPIGPSPNPLGVWVGPDAIIDAQYEEGVVGNPNQTCQNVKVKETLQTTYHNNGTDGEDNGRDKTLHAVNAWGAVWGEPPFEKKYDQKCTVGGAYVEPCYTIKVPFCEEIILDVEIVTKQHVGTCYTKNVNWVRVNTGGGGGGLISIPPATTTDALFEDDASLFVVGESFQMLTWGSIELDTGYVDTNPANDTSMASGLLTLLYWPSGGPPPW